VTLVVVSVAPRLTTAQATEIAPRMRPLAPKGPDGKSGWTTWYPVSERNYWSRNITIPARTLNGRMVLPGETLAFWDALGEVSRRTGYGPGGAIIGGRTQPTGALAGGICSASTTLFNAAARAGLRIIERHHHYYYIGRYPVGLDATVSKPRQDMVFQNDTAYPIVIRSSASPGVVHFEIWGVPDGRKTTFSRTGKRNYRHAIDTVVYTSSLAPGVRRRIESPTDGFDVSVTRTVRDRDGAVIHRDVFSSHYARVNGVVLVGRKR
jgi:vancomycin resistance protein YoaR